MKFEEFIKWARNHIKEQQEFPTLGKRSQFYAQYDRRLNSIKIKNSRRNTFTIKEERLRIIFARYVAAPTDMQHKPGYYNDPIWPTTSNRIFEPYIPAIIKYWLQNTNNRQIIST